MGGPSGGGSHAQTAVKVTGTEGRGTGKAVGGEIGAVPHGPRSAPSVKSPASTKVSDIARLHPPSLPLNGFAVQVRPKVGAVRRHRVSCGLPKIRPPVVSALLCPHRTIHVALVPDEVRRDVPSELGTETARLRYPLGPLVALILGHVKADRHEGFGFLQKAYTVCFPDPRTFGPLPEAVGQTFLLPAKTPPVSCLPRR